MLKKAQVIILPTQDNNSQLATYLGVDILLGGNIKKGELCTSSTKGWSDYFRPQHLYIISDDEIKEGKENIYYYDTNFNKISKWIGESNTYCKTNFKEIVATTDTSLMITNHSNGTWNYLPQPSQQFIEKYIESYNKDEVIESIMVEYETLKTLVVL